MKFFLIYLFCGIFGFPGLAQESQVHWNPEDKLEWTDFRGRADSANPFSANTSSGISYGWSLRKSGNEASDFTYNVFAFFVPEKSWVKEGKASLHLLAHEQLHFDITELHARKLRKQLKNFDPDSVKDLKATLQKMYREVEMESKKMQEQFERESAHSQNEEAQLKWQEKIKDQLQLLEEFATE